VQHYKFHKSAKLCAQSQFKHVFTVGHKKVVKDIAPGSMALFFCRNDLEHARLGIVVTKRNVHDANKRNAFKRVIRESFRLHQQVLPKFDIIVFLYATINNFTKSELRLCLEKQWGALIGCVPK
jgi:ribonuclease P protein component